MVILSKGLRINIITINYTDFKCLSVISGQQSLLLSLLSDGLCGKHDNMSSQTMFCVFNLTVTTIDGCDPMLNLLFCTGESVIHFRVLWSVLILNLESCKY